MIALDSKQGLPPKAFWYLALRSLAGALLLVLIGRLFQMAGPAARCSGALCGVLSSGQVAVFLYIFAVGLVAGALLRFKWFSFVLTDRSISINSGVIFQNCCVIRFDRIQDVTTMRDPLHMLLGLKSVAIWTASPDQRVGNTKRPDGLLVLTADDADWLRDFLCNPSSAGGATAAAAGPRSTVGFSGTRSGSGWLLPVVIVLIGVGVWGLSHKASQNVTASAPAMTNAPVVAAAPAMATAPTAARVVSAAAAAPTASGASVAPAGAPAASTVTNRHIVQVTAAAPFASQDYTIACAIHEGNGDVTPCGLFGEARRCEHEADFASQPKSEPVELTLVNRAGEPVKLYWLDFSGRRALYATLPPGGHVQQQSRIGAHWLVATQNDQCVGIFNAATMTVGIF